MSHVPSSRFREILALCAALSAFAANSLLSRWAMSRCAMDPAGFGSIRLLSAALTLLALTLLSGQGLRALGGRWSSALLLCVYAFCFSFAYVELSTGAGALILFGLVQVTMLGGAVEEGHRFSAGQLAGGVLALAGLFSLLAPGWQAPSLRGALLMAAAGLAWGLYSLRGRASGDPMRETTGNFLRSIPAVLVVAALAVNRTRLDSSGVLMAVFSGGAATGLGYVVWYWALKRISSARAAWLQLLVPLLSAVGGLVFLGEPFSMRLLASGALMVGGLAIILVVGEPGRYGRGGATGVWMVGTRRMLSDSVLPPLLTPTRKRL
ncbi:MAG TPA: DMT family transporter [Kiritimatiellia bacterium]|nr:DMT family transporter [Kiritimatiellia bacterium]